MRKWWSGKTIFSRYEPTIRKTYLGSYCLTHAEKRSVCNTFFNDKPEKESHFKPQCRDFLDQNIEEWNLIVSIQCWKSANRAIKKYTNVSIWLIKKHSELHTNKTWLCTTLMEKIGFQSTTVRLNTIFIRYFCKPHLIYVSYFRTLYIRQVNSSF